MPYRTAAEAAQTLLADLRRAVSCVSADVLIDARRHQTAQHPRTIFLPRRAAPLSGQPPLMLEVSHEYGVAEYPAGRGWWSVHTRAYRYVLYLRDGAELLAFHWHPDDPNPVKFPHLHLSAGAQVGFAPLTRAHLPTGPIELHEVLRLTIEDLGVRPLRSDWSDILSQPPQ